ncbi:MAG: hypothetical protein MUC29_08795 [Pyrinomonadaceae bacterium]|jgi:hypothetical protein|nr:hypothetical protein [Pyrinomonadaceae bacterium]
MNNLPKYIGYQEADFSTPWAKYFNENMPKIQPQAVEGLEKSPFFSLPKFEDAKNLADKGYAEIETGYSLEKDGSIHVAILTKMPNVSPEMWDWWFGWHGSKDNRYKLWHPKAHQSAHWLDEKDDEFYIGRTSVIQEYIGKSLEFANISFIEPNNLGLNSSKDSVYICARVGYTKYPINFGWLIHQVRKTAEGSEMRSRFWFGGKNIEVRKEGFLPEAVSKILQKIVPLPEQRAKDLLIHCAEEMNHLAKFLPEIYDEFCQK